MKMTFKVASYLLITIILYSALSLLKPVRGTIVFGSEVVVFTPRSWDAIDSLDYDKDGRKWYWVGHSEALHSLLRSDRKALHDSRKGYLEVEVRFVNLFFPSQASYLQKANVGTIYIASIRPKPSK
jgi:hypothetical protein